MARIVTSIAPRHGAVHDAVVEVTADRVRARFWSKVDRTGPAPMARPDLGGCWIWTGATVKGGYGTFRVQGRPVSAYGFAHSLLIGPPPPGLVPDHLCKVTGCVKVVADDRGPAHIEWVTVRENILRGDGPTAINARKTHCIHGHEFTPENTYVAASGRRSCRACHNRTMRDFKQAKRAQKLGSAREDHLDDAGPAQPSPEEWKSSDQRGGVITAVGEATR